MSQLRFNYFALWPPSFLSLTRSVISVLKQEKKSKNKSQNYLSNPFILIFFLFWALKKCLEESKSPTKILFMRNYTFIIKSLWAYHKSLLNAWVLSTIDVMLSYALKEQTFFGIDHSFEGTQPIKLLDFIFKRTKKKTNDD